MGNFGQAGAWVIANGAGSLTAERLKPEPAQQRWLTFRQQPGFPGSCRPPADRTRPGSWHGGCEAANLPAWPSATTRAGPGFP